MSVILASLPARACFQRCHLAASLGVNYESLVDSLVRIEGDSAPLFQPAEPPDGWCASVLSLRLARSRCSSLQPRDPFAVPAIPLSDLFRFSPRSRLCCTAFTYREQSRNDWPGRACSAFSGRQGEAFAYRPPRQTTTVPSWFLRRCRWLSRNHPVQALALEDAVFRATGTPIASQSPPLASISPR